MMDFDDDQEIARSPMESQPEAAIGVIVVDDCALFRDGISQALARSNGFALVDETATMGEAIRMVYEKRPDVIVLSGTSVVPKIDVIPIFRAVHPDGKILVIGIEFDERRAKAVLLAGAHAYASKSITPSELVDTVRAIHQDKKVVARSSRETYEAEALLTPREAQVLNRIAQGRSNKEIAHALRISERTVKQHVRNIFEKLDVHNRASAVLRAAPLTQ